MLGVVCMSVGQPWHVVAGGVHDLWRPNPLAAGLSALMVCSGVWYAVRDITLCRNFRQEPLHVYLYLYLLLRLVVATPVLRCWQVVLVAVAAAVGLVSLFGRPCLVFVCTHCHVGCLLARMQCAAQFHRLYAVHTWGCDTCHGLHGAARPHAVGGVLRLCVTVLFWPSFDHRRRHLSPVTFTY